MQYKRLLCLVGKHHWTTIRVWPSTGGPFQGWSHWFINECKRCGHRRRWYEGNYPPYSGHRASFDELKYAKQSHDMAKEIGQRKIIQKIKVKIAGFKV